jgi:hypothetical protein
MVGARATRLIAAVAIVVRQRREDVQPTYKQAGINQRGLAANKHKHKHKHKHQKSTIKEPHHSRFSRIQAFFHNSRHPPHHIQTLRRQRQYPLRRLRSRSSRGRHRRSSRARHLKASTRPTLRLAQPTGAEIRFAASCSIRHRVRAGKTMSWAGIDADRSHWDHEALGCERDGIA